MDRCNLLFCLLVLSSLITWSFCLENGLARTPPLGFSTWNAFPNVAIDEKTCYQLAEAIISTGMRDAGYNVFVVDEPCFVGRDQNGSLIENSKTWPNGLKAFGDYLHSNGMLLGIYTDQGPTTCGGCIASQGYEYKDMARFAEFGADYIKVDSCNRDVEPSHWATFRDAIIATKRPMIFSIIAQGQKDSWVWGNETGNLWRTTNDIMNNWNGVLSNLDNQENVPNIEKYAGPGAWNDPDMLVVGSPPSRLGSGLTPTEALAHFSLWAVLKAPLLASAWIQNLTADYLQIFLAPEILAINQDPLGVQGKKISGGPHSGSQLSSIPCDTEDVSQIWLINSDGTIRLKNFPNLCLTAQDCSSASGTPLIVYDCFPSSTACQYLNQKWNFVGQTIQSQLPGGACVAVGNNPLTLKKCDNSDEAERWSYNQSVGLFKNLESINTGCLGIANPHSFSSGEIYAGPLVNGAFAAVLFNRFDTTMQLILDYRDLGLPVSTTMLIRDSWKRQTLGTYENRFQQQLGPHSSRIITLTPL
eukprot:TRINITY_DN5972_c0_g1_i1.p1 TRINITY_DN5972_c0_g1~~TRINITY_DN5972_c0_g1_i1.p1  ORF type:complete len:529 (-),score=71.78 TRINITY_DN5972_c0_g1_i1:40-1626(-)